MAAAAAMRLLPFARSTTPLQAVTYLLGISLFSISFLVFLNSSISFVITDRIGVKEGVGNIVGTLGFVDELVALVACPVWGLVSDRLGVRIVAVIGYAVIAVALVLSVAATNVYPQLLLARVLFAVGATAAATMVTAILPSLTDESDTSLSGSSDHPGFSARNPRDSTQSFESQLTITPERFADSEVRTSVGSPDPPATRSRAGSRAVDLMASVPEDACAAASAADSVPDNGAGKPSKLAGLVGLFTGCGALVALVLFLPLPAQFGRIDGMTMADAVAHSFYVVALVALAVAAFVAVGLRHLRGEEGKGWHMLLGRAAPMLHRAASGVEAAAAALEGAAPVAPTPYLGLLRESVLLAFADPDIALGYLGGFVARASTVAISLFVPLFVNAFYIRNGFCQGAPNDPSPELKKECRAAYVLASIITGVAQLIGLLCAPLFGYLAGSRANARVGVNVPIVVATTFGMAGYLIFPLLPSPEFKDVNGRGGSPIVFLAAALIGISQIGAIVCSLGSLGKGVLAADAGSLHSATHQRQSSSATVVPANDDARETAPLLAGRSRHSDDIVRRSAAPLPATSRIRLKGSIAGVYSWCGGMAILLLAKLGGYLFDHASPGAPFYMMAVFNATLLLASLGIDAGGAMQRLRK